MRRRAGWGVLACLAVGLALPVRACPVDDTPPPVKVALQRADAVFLGLAISQRRHGGGTVTRFYVEKAWKGVDSREVQLEDRLSCMSYGFTVGGRYLVYANGSGPFATDRGTRNAPVQDAAQDLRELGKPERQWEPYPSQSDLDTIWLYGSQPTFAWPQPLRLRDYAGLSRQTSRDRRKTQPTR